MALDPNEPRWPYYLGHLSRMKGDTEGAAAYFERMLALRPDDVPSLVWFGNLVLDQGQADAAAASYERALAHATRPVRRALRAGSRGARQRQ